MSEVVTTPGTPAPVVPAAAPVAPPAPPEVVTPPIPETPVTPEPEAKDDRFSSKFAALSRREKALLAKETQLKDLQRTLESRTADGSDLRKKFKEAPLEALKEAGLSYDDLTRMMLNDKKPTAEMIARRAQEELESYKREQAEREQARTREQYEHVQRGFVKEISQFIDANAETYELTKTNPEAAEVVYNIIEQHHAKTKQVMEVKDAVELIEKHMEAEARKYLGLKKFQPKAETPPAPAAPTPPANPRTITNAVETQTPTPDAPKRMSVEESKAAAARLLKWS